MLEETQHLHAIIAGDAAASGESRRQARADFVGSLADTTTQIERAGRWLLETLLAMASAFANQPGRYESLRATLDCQIDAGPMTADDQQAIRDNNEAGLLSDETAMTMLGIEDVAAERQRIASEGSERRIAESASASAILGRAGLLRQEAQNSGSANGNGTGATT
jgi:hypothetical protein